MTIARQTAVADPPSAWRRMRLLALLVVPPLAIACGLLLRDPAPTA
jgi:hypothetical protein